MFGLLDYIKIGLGVVGGIAMMLVYNAALHDPMLKREARDGYVLEAQKTALGAKLDEMDRQKKAAEFVISAYQEQLKNARVAEAEKSQQNEQEIAAYEKRLADTGRACLLDGHDLDFLRQ